MNTNDTQSLRPLEDKVKEEDALKPIVNVNNNINNNNNVKEEIINELPDWNLEPPIEIKRGNE